MEVLANTDNHPTGTSVRERLFSRTLELLEDAAAVEIGRRIKDARERAGLSQGALAERLGLKSDRAVAYIERGERNPKRYARRVAKITGVNEDDILFGPQGLAVTPEDVERIVHDHVGAVPDLSRFVDAVTTLTDKLDRLNARLDEFERSAGSDAAE